jgi:hypothetical protein
MLHDEQTDVGIFQQLEQLWPEGVSSINKKGSERLSTRSTQVEAINRHPNSSSPTPMKEKHYSIAFTGHRPAHMDRYETAKATMEIEKFLKARLQSLAPRQIRVLVGGARGVDEIARQACVLLRIPYTLCIPHVAYRQYWSKAGLEEEYDIHLELAKREPNKLVFVVPESKPWSYRHNFARNEYMVRWCDEVCAVFKGRIPEDVIGKTGGGTRHCVEIALKAGKRWYHIDPRN